jgi:DNA-binding transcriptional regulator YiaG
MTPKELRKALEALEISQITAARWLSVDPRTVRRWLAGDRKVPGMAVEMIRTWIAEGRREIRREMVRHA